MVTALDATDSIAAGYAGTVHFTSTDGNALLPTDMTLTDGTGTFSATLRTAGSQTLTATDTARSSITGTSAPIDVSPGAATHFSVTSPVSATAGLSFSITVTALDQFNNSATGYSGTIHFTSSDVGAMLPGDSGLNHGTGNFNVTLITAASQTITATDMAHFSINGTSNSIAVMAAAATRFIVTAPAGATIATAFNVTVTAEDRFNNRATGYTGTVHFTSTDGAAVLPGNSTLTAGTAIFSVTLNTIGIQTVTATDTVISSITGTSNNIGVSAGPATHFAIVAPGSTTTGTGFTFTVTALDARNNRAFGYAGTVHFASSDPNAGLPPDSRLTNGLGIFTAILQIGGIETITGTDSINSSITGTSNTISVAVVATHFRIDAPANATLGTALSFTVTAVDQFDNTTSTYNGTVHFTSSDTFANLPGNASLSGGTGSFSATLFKLSNQTISVEDVSHPALTGQATILVDPPTNPIPPRVVGFTPSTTTGPISSVTVTFVGFVDATTFTSASFDVFHGPNGNIPLNSISVTEIIPTKVFAISFPAQSARGIYTMTFGPNLRDFAGNEMDQNDNGIAGEADDAFTGHFVIAPHSAHPELVVGADATGGPEVKVFDEVTHQKLADFYAYDPHFLGGVRVALGDINGDGIPDVITAPGAGGGPDIRVWDISSGTPVLIREFMAYSPFFAGGVFVASGDVNGDGRADITTGAGAGGGPEVKVFSGKDNSIIMDVMAYSPFFNGGATVATGDVNGDGYADVITGAGPGGGPHVKVYSGKTLTQIEGYYAFNPTFNGGVNVALADIIGTGRPDVVAGTATKDTLINVFDGLTGAALTSFYAPFPTILVGGVRVGAISSLDGGLSQEILAAAAPGNAPRLIAYDNAAKAVLDSFYAFNPFFQGGVYIGGS